MMRTWRWKAVSATLLGLMMLSRLRHRHGVRVRAIVLVIKDGAVASRSASHW
jgi:hypothetical protein